MNIVDI